jgi:translocation and assembly module TamB
LKALSFQEKSNFSLQTLQGDFKLEEKTLSIDNLIVESGDSKLQLSGNASFNSLTDYQTARIDFEIPQSTLATKDILFFAPHLLDSIPLSLPRETRISIASKISGTFNNLTIDKLAVGHANEHFTIDAGKCKKPF